MVNPYVTEIEVNPAYANLTVISAPDSTYANIVWSPNNYRTPSQAELDAAIAGYSAGANLNINPYTYSGNIGGTITNANLISTTTTNTNAWYPVMMSSTTASGYQSPLIDTSLLFNPSNNALFNSGNISSNNFLGNLSGNVNANVYGTVYGNIVGTTGSFSGNLSAGNLVGAGTFVSGVYPVVTIYPGSMDFPNNSNWPQATGAFIEPDPSNSALNVRAFDDTLVTGVGFTYSIPPNAVNLTLSLKGRANTPPAAGSNNTGVVLGLYNRQIPNNAAVTSWSTMYTLSTITVPNANAYFIYVSQTIPLSTLGITAGQLTQFELVRNGPAAGDTLSGNFLIAEIQLKWS